MRWTIAQVAGALDTRPGAGLDPLARVAGVSIDSRAIRPGELFFAVHGPRHDGHTFVADVLAGGALAAVVAQGKVAQIPEDVRALCLVLAGSFVALKLPGPQA